MSNNINNNNDNNNINQEDESEIMYLTNQLIKANEKIEQQNIIINNLQQKLNKCENDLKNYQNIINQKNNELNNLKLQLMNNNNNQENLQSKIYKNEMMCVNFISMDQNVNFAVACTKDTLFAEVEEKLYKQYPTYRETNNTFIANGTQVLRFKTIAENKIGNGLPIALFVPS